MGQFGINYDVLLNTIGKLPDQFYTKDVSNHPDMVNAHPHLIKHSHYHSFVGKSIKRFSVKNGKPILNELKKHTSKGSLWIKSHEIKSMQILDEGRANLSRKFITPRSEKKWVNNIFLTISVFGMILSVLGTLLFGFITLILGLITRSDSWKAASKDSQIGRINDPKDY